MTHDPLCPQGEGASISTTPYGLEDFPCLCELIAKVREDAQRHAGGCLCPMPNVDCEHPTCPRGVPKVRQDGRRDMLARLTSEEAHAVIVKVLNDEGAASEGGWHGWRCFDKGRYPEPCRCTEYVVDQVLDALRGLQEKP